MLPDLSTPSGTVTERCAPMESASSERGFPFTPWIHDAPRSSGMSKLSSVHTRPPVGYEPIAAMPPIGRFNTPPGRPLGTEPYFIGKPTYRSRPSLASRLRMGMSCSSCSPARSAATAVPSSAQT